MQITLSIEAMLGLIGLSITIIGYQHAIWRAIANLEKKTVTHEICEKRQEKCCSHLREILRSKNLLSIVLAAVSVALIITGCSFH